MNPIPKKNPFEMTSNMTGFAVVLGTFGIAFCLIAAFSEPEALLFLFGTIVFTLLASIAHTLAKIGTQIWEARRDQRVKDLGPDGGDNLRPEPTIFPKNTYFGADGVNKVKETPE